MADKTLKLKTQVDEHKKMAQDILGDALKENFETVLVIGIKDGRAHFTYSAVFDGHKVIGMIEDAKLSFARNWTNGE